MNNQRDLFQDALNPALRILKAGPKSRYEIAVKLEAKGFEPAVVEDVLQYLEKKNFLNDRRLAEDIIRRLTEVQPSGRKRIEFELEKRGINAQTGLEMLQRADEREHERARSSALGKWNSLKNTEPQKRRQKVASFLVQRGFENDLVEDILASFPDDDAW